MNNNSIVTVVMAVYNASKTLHRAIDSLINQTYNNWLLICVNDGSTDNSLGILQQYALNDPRIKVLSQKNGGPAAARAKAYEIVSTPYAIILDSDDTYSSDLLECLTETALRTHADAIVPNVRIEQTDGSFMDWNQTFHFHAGMEMKGGFGMVLLEAMSCGVPVVSFDCPCGPKDLITDGENGYLVEDGDIEKLADRIVYLIRHPEKRKEMGAMAYKRSADYSEDKIMKQWMELFSEVLVDSKKNS